MRKNINKLIYIVLISIVLPNTGIFVEPGTSAFGVWGKYTIRDCDGDCNAKNFTLDYISKFGLEVSIGVENDEIGSYLGYGSFLPNLDDLYKDQIKTSLSYYFKANRTGYRVRVTSTKVKSYSFYDSYNYNYYDYYYDYWGNQYTDYFYDYGSIDIDISIDNYTRFDFTFFDSSGFYATIAKTSISLDLNIHLQECYGTSYYDCYNTYEYVEESADDELIEFGKYFNFGSYILGIEYQNAIDNIDNFEDGNIIFSIGSVFN